VLAYKLEGKQMWNRVGVEPSGTPFNSLVQLANPHSQAHLQFAQAVPQSINCKRANLSANALCLH